MPELPEVETTRRGLAAHLAGDTVRRVTVRDPRLRLPVPAELPRVLTGQTVTGIRRRAKYLLLDTARGSAIVHLGMSGSLRLVPADCPHRPHDHVELTLESGRVLRFHDPRRFGLWLWTDKDPLAHPLLAGLGPEPLEPGFDGAYLHDRARGRRAAVKAFIMDGRIVVGVGNIYASEALYEAGVHPARAAGRVSRLRYERLADAIRSVLGNAIERGGTTLRDFVGEDGSPGYFQLELMAYGRAGEPCRRCGTSMRHKVIGQRATVYCPACQR